MNTPATQKKNFALTIHLSIYLEDLSEQMEDL